MHADPLARPITLYQLLKEASIKPSKKQNDVVSNNADDENDASEDDEPPALDARFRLAASLANGLYEMHSAGWLHRNISSRYIYFLWNRSTGVLDLETPYLGGFEVARSLTAFTSSRSIWDPETVASQHPGCLFYKRWGTFRRDDKGPCDTLFYMPRHYYYSLALVLLEIRLWQSRDEVACLKTETFDPNEIRERAPEHQSGTLTDRLRDLDWDMSRYVKFDRKTFDNNIDHSQSEPERRRCDALFDRSIHAAYSTAQAEGVSQLE